MVSPQTDFPLIFKRLKTILKPYAAQLTLTVDTAQSYSIDGPYSQKYKRVIFFGAVHIKKNYVSFYLMPVYMYPDLLTDISPGLKKHMQGKSCFNFKKVDETLFKELAELTHKSFELFQKED